MYKDEYGDLFCPNCKRQGMNKYTFWSSRLINEYTKQWIFYNKIKKKREWKCWSIIELCGKKIHNWYDPCKCCFNPCKINEETRKKADAEEQLCIVILKFLFIYELFAFIYIGYVFLFLWFDIFYFLCYREKLYVILMPIGEEKIIPVKDGLWKNFETTGYTDYFWEDNFPNLFKCEKCNYAHNTFYKFLRKDGIMVYGNNTQDTGPQLVNTTNFPVFPQ